MIISRSSTNSRLIQVCAAMFLLAAALFSGTEVLAQGAQSLTMTLRLQDAANTIAMVNEFAAAHANAEVSEFTAAYANAEVNVLDARPTVGAVQRPRHIEYSADQIVIVGLASDGAEKSRVVMADPRLVRAELFIGGDQWESKLIYRRTVDFSVALPDDPAIVTISVLKPRWTGSEWQFDVLAETLIK